VGKVTKHSIIYPILRFKFIRKNSLTWFIDLKKRALQDIVFKIPFSKLVYKNAFASLFISKVSYFKWLIFLSGIFLYTGCEIYDPPQKIPAYIQVDSFSFSTDDNSGFNTQKIKEVWIFVNGEQIGTYSVPTKPIPALAEGNSTVEISAGVSADGIAANKVLYPFYRQFKEIRNLEKGKVSKFLPRFGYDSNFRKLFTYYQDFERSDSGVSNGNTGTVKIKTEMHTPSEAFAAYGSKYGRLTALTDIDILEFTNEVWIRLNETGLPIYLEFDYKSTVEAQVGVLGKLNNQGPVLNSYDLVIKPTEKWTKVYVNLTDEVGLFRPETGYYYRFFIRTPKPPGIGKSISIDNIRLINYPN